MCELGSHRKGSEHSNHRFSRNKCIAAWLLLLGTAATISVGNLTKQFRLIQ